MGTTAPSRFKNAASAALVMTTAVPSSVHGVADKNPDTHVSDAFITFLTVFSLPSSLSFSGIRFGAFSGSTISVVFVVSAIPTVSTVSTVSAVSTAPTVSEVSSTCTDSDRVERGSWVFHSF